MTYEPVNSSNTLAASVADLNNAFDLLLGLSHGSTAPSSPESWQPWLDSTTSAATLKIRNSANDAWIPVHRLESQSGPVLADGTNTINLVAPSAIGTSYTLTLPPESQLPDTSGNFYVLVDRQGSLSFSATGP